MRTVFGTVLALIVALAAPAGAQLRATLVASGFDSPTGFIQHPADPAVQLVLEQDGRIRLLRNGVTDATDFLDLRDVVGSGGERGLLGLAFSPDYATSGRVFVSFTDRSGHSVLSRFTRRSGDPLRPDPDSRFDLVWPDGQRFITQPFSNHNGGNIAFGPDGFLYLGLGDGGSGNDPGHLAQDPRALLGKMLRLDVSVPTGHSRGYTVPASNPFAGRSDVLGEIWAFGLRNPWRWSFDDPRLGGTGALVIADVGQGAWEEIDYEPAGAGGRNYGWRNREGAHPNVTSQPPFFEPLRDPVFEYSRDDGRSITGGFVYRGSGLGAAFAGRYFFADFIRSRVWSIGLQVDPNTREAAATSPVEHTAELGSAATTPSSFGVDAAGELYLVSYEGAIYRIESTVSPPPVPEPDPPPSPSSPGTGTQRRRTGPSIGTAQPRPPGSPVIR